ncbi:hypothetical protein ACSTS3_22580 [Aquimarina muelleri]|uniref:hypothetical protein n=1 Tax=Aquimarina muelleri TaxID=279356 RepID=UPI003F688B61
MAILKGCDMVISISQDTVNYQFYTLLKDNVIKRKWNVIVFEDGSSKSDLTDEEFNEIIADPEEVSCAFNANILDPEISILPDSPKLVNLSIPFENGTMYYWKGRSKPTFETVDMNKWIYVFKVEIGSIEKNVADDPSLSWMCTNESIDATKKVIIESGVSQKYFTIESLFLDLESADYASYSTSESYIPVPDVVKADFQNLLSNYFTSLAETDNPYILGYAVKVKDIPNQEEAMFAPTALKYSTTYNKNPALSAFNFLMMTEGKDFPRNTEDLGVFTKSLITDPTVNGEFSINADLFCEKIIDHIDFNEIYANSLKTVKDKIEIYDYDRGMFSVDNNEVERPISYGGKLKKEGYGLNAIEKPYIYTVQGRRNTVVWTSSNGFNFNEMTSLVPVIKFFSKNFSIKQHSITKKVELRKLSHWSKEETKNYRFSIKKFDESFGEAIYLGVANYLNAQQNTRCEGAFGIAHSYEGYCNTKSPQFTYYKIEAATDGRITVTDYTINLETENKLIHFDKKGVIGNSINNFEENLKNATTECMEEITKILKNLSMNKVIFPCNKIYKYEDLRFEFNTDDNEVSDNCVKAKIKYKHTQN